MYYIRTESSFDSAHFLHGYNGKCKNIHGHRWKVVAEIKSDSLHQSGNKKGMVVDFSDLKRTLKQLCDELDHSLIYESGSLKSETIKALKNEDFKLIEVYFRPTAENFTKYFCDKLLEFGFNVSRVEVYESPTNCAIYEA